MSDNQALESQNNVLIEGQDTSDQGGNSTETKKVSRWTKLKTGILKHPVKFAIGLASFIVLGISVVVSGLGIDKNIKISNNVDNVNNIAYSSISSVDTNYENVENWSSYIVSSEVSSEEEKNNAQDFLIDAQEDYVNAHAIYGDSKTLEGVQATVDLSNGNILSNIAGSQDKKFSNVYSAYANFQLAQNQSQTLSEISENLENIANQTKELYEQVNAKEEGIEAGKDQGVNDVQQSMQSTVQAIINGKGDYYNLAKSENVVKYIGKYLVDGDSNGKADLLEVVEDIESDKSIPESIRLSARSEWDKINDSYLLAQTAFEEMQGVWQDFLDKANSGDNVGAVALYNDNINPYVAVLNQCKSTADNGYEKVNKEYASLIQQDQEITGQFSQEDINRYKNAFTQVGSFGEISEVLYNYNKSTGELNIILTGTNLFNTSEKIRTIYTLTTNNNYNNLDSNSVMKAFQNCKNPKVENFLYSNSYENSSAIVSNNGISENITGTMDVWYDISSKYNSTTKKTTITVNAQVMLDDGTIVEKGISSINVNGKPTKSEKQAYVKQLINKTVSSMSNVKLGDQIINEIERN